MTTFELQNELLDMFHGLSYGGIEYSFTNQNTVMGDDIGEIFDGIAGDIVIAIDSGEEIADRQLEELSTNLRIFAEEFEVDDANKLADKVDILLKERQG